MYKSGIGTSANTTVAKKYFKVGLLQLAGIATT